MKKRTQKRIAAGFLSSLGIGLVTTLAILEWQALVFIACILAAGCAISWALGTLMD
jgi:hypothetical protein